MISANNLKNGTIFLMDEAPYQVIEVKHLHMGRGGSSIQTKIKNLATGQVLSRNFKESDSFGDADVEKGKIKFLYTHRENTVFINPGKSNERLSMPTETLGDILKWLKPNTECEAVFLTGKIISIKPPIKIELKVIESPPGLKGDRAQSGTKNIKLETGASINVPLFIEEGDIIRINTETGEYTERVTKS
ncbi:MAG: elongation factor P [Candidatus Sungbacteria bacterium RIFCSPLOWO2_12_FULL_41_11]|uniref:Elongation factor P n=1 Tax=Candidatus Sungbacteria bacterium RIFCSPLOWO2_12_FULL_41_11 TaxID=1802286 RepID=A0A1G2LSI2_9BACT|nr:MAG: elongation factor P [Candidatus Sungbacteria bacterium RIFCSPLOWO2_12_FULL_41_11]